MTDQSIEEPSRRLKIRDLLKQYQHRVNLHTPSTLRRKAWVGTSSLTGPSSDYYPISVPTYAPPSDFIVYQEEAEEPDEKPTDSAVNGHGFSAFNTETETIISASDLWSSAYREAVENFKDELDIALLEGKNLTELFQKLDGVGKEASKESAFSKGVNYLRSLQVPLEKFKLALDLASPIANLEPTATTVVGVVRVVTAIAISFATADMDFAKQIAGMLEQIQYIDDCDTLGQKADISDIHKALVAVYQKILEFYKTAVEILSRKGAKLIVKLVLENDRLPHIVNEFLRCCDNLQRLIQKAVLEITNDIQLMLYDNEIDKWLGSEKMRRQRLYHESLQELRSDQACDHVLKIPGFVNWYHHTESQQLVLVGEVGCGKSVAMSFIIDHLSRSNEYQIPQPKICYYYCRDYETGETVAIFSALLLSLLKQLPGLKKPFVEWYRHAQSSGDFDPSASARMLNEFLHNALRGIDRPVFIVIDGLDECKPVSRNSLLKSLNSLSQVSGIKVLISSRPEERILRQLRGVTRIELVSNAERDRLIASISVERQLPYLSEKAKEVVIKELSENAKGSAIWTKMIVEMIGLRGFTAIGMIKSFLKKMPLPTHLSELYFSLLSRCTNNITENKVLAGAALKILATSWRPLSIIELAWAATLSAEQHITSVEELEDFVDYERILAFIYPFIARVDSSDLRKWQVRLTHQSVKEFLIKEWPSLQPSETGEINLDRKLDNPSGFVLDLCIRYLLLDDVGDHNLFSDEQMAISELPQSAELFEERKGPIHYDPLCSWEVWEEDMILYDPTERGFGEFFVYASTYWVKYLGATSTKSLPSLASLETICQAGSTILHNWTQQNCRPGCAILARFNFYSQLYDPLVVVSLYGSEAVLVDMLANSKFESHTYFKETAMYAADQVLQQGNLSRLKILFFDRRLGYQLHTLDFFKLVIKRWQIPTTYRSDWNDAFDLIDGMSVEMVEGGWANELLCFSASVGCVDMISRMLSIARREEALADAFIRGCYVEGLSPLDEPTHQSIGQAILGNHIDVVTMLLEEKCLESHLRYRNSRGENVLHLAAKLCDCDMFQVLVPAFLDGIDQTDNKGNTAMDNIILHPPTQGRYESATTLLSQSKVNWSQQEGGLARPLQLALQLRDVDMCFLLLKFVGEFSFAGGVSDQNNVIDRSLGKDDMLDQLIELFAASKA